MLWRGSRRLYRLATGPQNYPTFPLALKLARTSDPSQMLELISASPEWQGSLGFCLRAVARSLKHYKMPHSVLTDSRYIALKQKILSQISVLDAQETCDVVFWMRVLKEQGRENVKEVMEEDRVKLAARIEELAGANLFNNRQHVSLLYDLSILDLSLPPLEERLLHLLNTPNESFTLMELKQVLYVLSQWRFRARKEFLDLVFKRMLQEGLESADLISIMEIQSTAINMKQFFNWEHLDLLVLHCQDAILRRFDSLPEFGLKKIIVQYISHPADHSPFASQLYKRLETFLPSAPFEFYLELMHYFAKLTLLHPTHVPERFLSFALQRFQTDFTRMGPNSFEQMIFNLASLKVDLGQKLIAALENYGNNLMSPGLWTLCALNIRAKSDPNFLTKYTVPDRLEANLLTLLPYQQVIAYANLRSLSNFPSSPELRKLIFLVEEKITQQMMAHPLAETLGLLQSIDRKGRVDIGKQAYPLVVLLLSTLEREFPNQKLQTSLQFILRVFPICSSQCRTILRKYVGVVNPWALSTFMRTHLNCKNFPVLIEILAILQEKADISAVLNALKEFDPVQASDQTVKTFQALLNRNRGPVLLDVSFYTHLETLFQIIQLAPERSRPFCARLAEELKLIRYPPQYALKVFYRLSTVYNTSSFQSDFVLRAKVRGKDFGAPYLVLLTDKLSSDLLESLPVLKFHDSKFDVVDKAKAVLKTGDKDLRVRLLSNLRTYLEGKPIDFGVDFLKELMRQRNGNEVRILATELLAELMRKLSISTPSLSSQITLLRFAVDLDLRERSGIERLVMFLIQTKWMMTNSEVEAVREMMDRLGCDSKSFSDSR